MFPSRVNDELKNNSDDARITHNIPRPRAYHNHVHQPHHYEVLHPRGLLYQQGILPGIHQSIALPEGAPPPPWRPLPPPPPWASWTTTGSDITSSTDLDSFSSTSTAEYSSTTSEETVSVGCSCQCHHMDLPPCYTCCEKVPGESSKRPFSCSGESLYSKLTQTIPYTTCHTYQNWGNSTLDVRLPRNNSIEKSQSTRHKLKQKLATENEDENTFWWLANLEENLAWGVFIFHMGVIPLLLVYSGRIVYCFILPIFFFFCVWVVVRRCGRAVHPCQVMAKLSLSISCLMLAIGVCELMNCHMTQNTTAVVALSIILLAALPTGYLICKKDELLC